MHRYRWTVLPLLLAVLALAPGAVADEDTATETAPNVGEKVTGFEGPSLDGGTLTLDALTVTPEKAREAAAEAARAFGIEGEVGADTALRDAPEVTDEDGEVDEDRVHALVAQAGRPFGLIPPEGAAESMKTVGDVVAWIEGAKDSPILVSVWSPRCPMCKGPYDSRINEIAAEHGVRFVAVAGNYPDDPEEHIKPYLEENEYTWQVVLDPDQKLVDQIGATRTPHLFLIGADGTLHYKGTVDNDPRGRLEDEERKDYLIDAIEAVKSGEAVEVEETEPAG